jgi:hypothetical protein
MSLIVGVHGIAKQQLGRRTIRDAWRLALGDGMERAGMPREAPEPDLDVAFYGDVFLPKRGGDGHKGTGSEDWLLADLDEEEAAELAELAAEDLPEEAFEDQDPELTGTATKGYSRSPGPLQSTLRALDRYFWPSAGVLYIGALRQVRRYLRDPDAKAEVQARVHEAVTAQGNPPRVLLGHSLGSVVAVEYLRLHPEIEVDLLLTCGSPLGAAVVRRRLPDVGTAPANAAAWTDVRDRNDPVACSGPLSKFWPGVVDRVVDNQSDAHAAERYLRKAATGAPVLAVLGPAATGQAS